jgi:hypothetical protein
VALGMLSSRFRAECGAQAEAHKGNRLTRESVAFQPSPRTVLSNVVTAGHRWIWKLIKIKYDLEFASSVTLATFQVLSGPWNHWLLT